MSVRRWCVFGFSLWLMASSGCALWHELQPHRLRRLNRVPPPHLDPEFTKVESDFDTILASGTPTERLSGGVTTNL